LNPVEPAEKTPNQLDQIRKGKSIFTFQSPVKAKGSGENSDAGEVDRGGVPVVGEVDVGGGGERDEDEVDVGQGGERDDGMVDGDGGEEEKEKEVEVETERSDEESNNEPKKVWNLRPRKPAKKEEKQSGGGGSGEGSSRKPATRSQRRAEMPQRMELKLSLTNEEIEHDFLLMTGQKPPKKPNKRPTKVQKSIEVIIFSLFQ
jgi:hypothetical protein